MKPATYPPFLKSIESIGPRPESHRGLVFPSSYTLRAAYYNSRSIMRLCKERGRSAGAETSTSRFCAIIPISLPNCRFSDFWVDTTQKSENPLPRIVTLQHLTMSKITSPAQWRQSHIEIFEQPRGDSASQGHQEAIPRCPVRGWTARATYCGIGAPQDTAQGPESLYLQ